MSFKKLFDELCFHQMARNCEKLVSIEIIGDWLTSKEGVIKVQLNENFCYRYFDYIALYKVSVFCYIRSFITEI